MSKPITVPLWFLRKKGQGQAFLSWAFRASDPTLTDHMPRARCFGSKAKAEAYRRTLVDSAAWEAEEVEQEVIA